MITDLVPLRRIAALLLLSLATLPTACARPVAAEPEVVLCTCAGTELARQVVAPFEEATGIPVRIERISRDGGGEAVARRLDEARGDVFWGPEVTVAVDLARLGRLARLEPLPAGAAGIPARFRDPEGRWFGFAARARVLVVNTDLVPADRRPTSMWDVIDPRWKGRTAFTRPGYGTACYHIGALEAALGQAECEHFLRGVETNGCVIAPGDGALARLVAAGGACFGFTDTSDALRVAESGAPVEIVYPDQDGVGTLILPNTLGVLTRAPHPEAARRLCEFLLSAEVEARLAEGSRRQIPLRPGVAHPPAVRVCDDLRELRVDAVEAARLSDASEARWAARFVADPALVEAEARRRRR
ncbi:MAG: extracellular solute-binding protein [Planctomycetota bacterium]